MVDESGFWMYIYGGLHVIMFPLNLPGVLRLLQLGLKPRLFWLQNCTTHAYLTGFSVPSYL